MGYGYVGKDASAEFKMVYEYAGSEYYDPNEFYDYLRFNIEMATDTKTYQEYVPQIGDLAVQFAQDFIVSNGTYRTGNLYRSVKWKKTSTGISLFADARDGKKGKAYAGHIEYGFVGRDGMPRGPWPFLRPAMRLAAEASKGTLARAAAMNILYGREDNSLSFGRANIQHLLGASGVARGSRSQYSNAVGRRFGAGQGASNRWTGAKHGIDHMGTLKSDTSKDGKAMYESFLSKFGAPMNSLDFHWGDL